MIHTSAGFKPDLGDVPTWLGVLFAAAAGAVALLLYLRESERDKRSDEDRRRRDEEARQAQAALVCAWYGMKTINAAPFERWGSYVRNASEVPVYDMLVEFHFTSPRLDGGEWTLARGQERIRVVPPGEHFVPASEHMLRQVNSPEPYVVSITFRDAGNRRWTRDPTGTLTDIPPTSATSPAA